jgi:hypothetical protein
MVGEKVLGRPGTKFPEHDHKAVGIRAWHGVGQ